MLALTCCISIDQARSDPPGQSWTHDWRAVQIVALAAPGPYGSKAVHCVMLLRLLRLVRVFNLTQARPPDSSSACGQSGHACCSACRHRVKPASWAAACQLQHGTCSPDWGPALRNPHSVRDNQYGTPAPATLRPDRAGAGLQWLIFCSMVGDYSKALMRCAWSPLLCCTPEHARLGPACLQVPNHACDAAKPHG